MNWYPKAIEALSTIDADAARGVLFRIAARHPKVIVDACESADAKNLRETCKSLMQSGQMVQAVKLWRNYTGAGLKEAKDAVEAL